MKKNEARQVTDIADKVTSALDNDIDQEGDLADSIMPVSPTT